ncbi:EAL domain-containing protein [Actinoplanes sp. TBRC 11911]|uniref:putative bifunctional diguanylate cyclase/phosphodiesterase n=1 Tax=Actinoplanes sp. TBRC 11911 TaxID=2729386 RepID=UPI00145EFF00|nr:EAL domain-containing protein [Actinoplanes sp. TBRC 11911]NMO55145.1 EAL domain-containing protein [Actinoplanes sp. TBRC 11911]
MAGFRRRSALLAFVAVSTLVVAAILLPARAVAGLLIACSGAFAVVMIRAVRTRRAAGPHPRALSLAAGILLTALAGAAAALAVLIAPDVLVAGGVPLPAEIPLVTLFFVAGAYLPATLRPHQRRDLLARLRAALDMLGLTACLIFTPWLVLTHGDEQRGATMTALILGATAAAVVAVSGVHAIRHRAALQWCGPGAALSLVGLTALVIGMDYQGEPNAAIAALAGGLAVNVAAALMWYGSVRIRPDARPIPPAGSEPSAGFPLLALPILGSALATVYHLITGGRLDPVAIILGTVAITAVATREWVSAIVLRRHADHLTDQGNRLRSLVFGSADVAMILDADLAVRWQSPAAARQFGLSDQDVLGRTASALVHPGQADALHAHLTERMVHHDPTPFPVRLRDGFGRWRDTEWTTSGGDPAEPGRTLVVHVRDVSDLRSLEQALRDASHLDQQTGLANREGLRRAGELTPDTGAMIVIELGGLAAIGDVHGPDLAEVVVAEAARRLRTRMAGGDVPARLSETRFAVLTRSGAVRAHLLASQLLTALTTPYSAAGTAAHLSAWAGLADLTAQVDIDEVIRRAGLAMRSVRSGPPGAVEWYDEQMEIKLRRRSTLERDLPGAVQRGALELNFQLVVELPGGRPVGVESLLTWRHPTQGVVSADELLAPAEDLGLLAEIGQWTLHRSCRLLADWRRQHEDLWVAINVRPRELVDPAFQAAMQTALETHQIPPSALVVEVSERDLIDQQPAVEDLAAQLGRLRAQGVRTAVDNFGAGPTSLSRLRILPIDLLKVDRDVFGQPAGTLPQIGAVMDVTVALGRRLGMEVIAHGLQQSEDLEVVQAAGCRLGQGDLLGKPMPAEHLEALLERQPR